MSARALVLLSGGLDSLLAARLLLEQGIDVTGVNFVTPFFTGRGREGRWPERAARALGCELRVVALGADYVEMLRAPRHGRGRGMNPCEDCHGFMLRRAGELLEREGADFVASGEVLGQRPRSQRRRSLERIAAECGLGDRLLRPLSARLLEPTRPERQGLVDRERLLDIRGRSRKRQLELAARWGLTEFSAPAGGCSLTDPHVSRRLRDLFELGPEPDNAALRQCLFGRHFRLRPDLKAVLGRNQAECQRLERLAGRRLVMEPVTVPGPLLVASGRATAAERELLGRLLLGYTGKARGRTEIAWRQGTESGRLAVDEPLPAGQVRQLEI